MMWKGQKRRRCQKKCTVLAQESLLSLTKRTFSCDLLLNTTSPNNNAHPLLNIPARKTSVFFGSLHVHLPQTQLGPKTQEDLSDGTGVPKKLGFLSSEIVEKSIDPEIYHIERTWKILGIKENPVRLVLKPFLEPFGLVSGQIRHITRKATARGTSRPTGGRIHTLSFLGRIFKNSRGVHLVAIHDHHYFSRRIDLHTLTHMHFSVEKYLPEF